MISKLKRRFIALAMVSLVTMLTVVVAGMNIINYNAVVSAADETLEALSSNRGRLPMIFGDGLDGMNDEFYGDEGSFESGPGGPADDDADVSDGNSSGSGTEQNSGDSSEGSDKNGKRRNNDGRGGNAPSWMSRDEAEETRFFSALIDSTGDVITVNTNHIFAVNDDTATDYAVEVMASGNKTGFVGDYRYLVSEEGNYTRVTFMDCGRTLEAFRTFLYASIAMAVVGLAIIFAIICYFAGRIVRPVAESYDKQKRFITDAGHEIKTPLTIIKANIDVMKMDMEDVIDESSELAENLNESLDDISGQVDRLTTLTNDLVYLSRMEEASGTLTMTEVPISDIVKETAEPFRAVATERNKELNIDITPMLSMQGSTKELEKLVSILVENALKYSPEGDCIGVSLHKEGRNVVFEVRNKATTPLSEEDLAHVFERFYRTDKSRNSAAGGHGIGLSMASAIVGAHGGKIRARGGDGTEFIVTATMPIGN